MSDYYCPHCGADLGDQPGFDPDAGYWTCTECGQFLTDPEDESDRFDGVGWFCDECGAYLNKQIGFSDWYDTWTCTECGHVNNLSEDEIYESEEAYQASKEEEGADDEDEDDGYGYGEEWQYGHPRRCGGCDRLLNKQDGFEEWLGSFMCEKCGYYNVWSTDEDDEEDDDEESSVSFSYSGETDSFSDYNDEYGDDDDDEYGDDDDDDEVESYEYSEEYERRVQAEARRREEKERQREEQRRAKEEKRRQRQEYNREQRKRLWRTITGKKQVIGLSSEQCQQMRYEDVVNLLKSREFYNISVVGSEDLTLDGLSQEGIVGRILINGVESFDASAEFPFNAKIDIVYHMLKTALPPLTSKSAKRLDIDDVVWEFGNMGFQNIYREAIPDLTKGWLVKEDSVERIAINGRTDYKKSERFRLDSKIVISYHTFKNGR